MTSPTYRKKLIEVALPLEAINRESAREKSIRHGHPSTVHLWWARRPLAACRAVLFASLVDDPSSLPGEFPTQETQDRERQRLFRIIEDLVRWENSTNETVLAAARAEILRSTDGNPPPVLDPFCGGGSIPLEAQRLGLEAHGSDLNPVPVLITKALIEIPPKFAGHAPVNPEARLSIGHSGVWRGAAGIAEDVRYYGRWMRDEAERRIGKAYPDVRLSEAHGGIGATVIAWLWARTVKCPNPACGTRMPLVRSFALATKKGKEAWVEAVVDRTSQPPIVSFRTCKGQGGPRAGTVNRRGASCIACGSDVDFEYIREEGRQGRMEAQLMAIVAEGNRQRAYLSPSPEQEQLALSAVPAWTPESALPKQALGFRVQAYGMVYHRDLFTNRQLLALSTFSDLVGEVRERIVTDAQLTGDPSTLGSANADGEYANAVATYLGMVISRIANYGTTICSWHSGVKYETVTSTFGRQTLQMTWDYAEANPFSASSGNWLDGCDWIARVIEGLPARDSRSSAIQADAARLSLSRRMLVSTDPPYYDNIGYADLSDVFYVWLRRALAGIHPQLFKTLLTPKAEELIASPFRFDGNRVAATRFFETGLGAAFVQMHKVHDPRFPLTIFYAFKQSETVDEDNGDEASDSIASTGWETMLEGVIGAGFLVDGTWPMRTELVGNLKKNVGALASSIVLVCRSRDVAASSATRRQYLAELKRELPSALRDLQHGNIAPVDLAQAAIGPGIAVFSRYAQVLESDGRPMRVRTALALINQCLAETLAEQEGEMDADTRWALTWFDQYGFSEGPFGDANTLANAKNTSTDGLVEAGVIVRARGKVRLLSRGELSDSWNPSTDLRRTVWEATHHLIRRLDTGGEQAASLLLGQLGEDGQRARDLAYRLYTTCERRGWTQDAQAYNSLVVVWPELSRQTERSAPSPSVQTQATLAL